MHVLTEVTVIPQGAREEVAAIADQLGLTAQAQRHLKASVESAFKPLTSDEWTLWQFACPKQYAGKELANYRFDTIPVEVLRHWKKIKEIFHFDEFVIRTTERTEADLVDPILVGYHGPNRFLLARWGDEAPESLKMTDIAEKVLDRARERAALLAADYPFQPKGSRIRSNMLWLERHSGSIGPAISAAKRVLGIATA